MKSLKIFLAMLVLIAAACRTVPSEVATQHDMSMQQSEVIFEIAESMLKKIEDRVVTLNGNEVAEAYSLWSQGVRALVAQRVIVQGYLNETKADNDVNSPYAIGHQLLVDMTTSFREIAAYWPEMIDPENDLQSKEFVALFRKDMKRYSTLERKFDDWISQFKVKG